MIGGNIDRELSDAERTAAGHAVAEVIRACHKFPPEVATYALAGVVDAMTSGQSDRSAARDVLLAKIREICA